MTTRYEPAPEQLAMLAQVIQDLTRARRMRPHDAEDFAQSVQLHMVEGDYDVFRQFAGRSSLRTYLLVVVQRMLLDWQNREYGRWRPTVCATRLGPFAVDLEQHISRDGLTRDEAIELVRRRTGAPPAAELQRMADQLPPRLRRRKVPEEVLLTSSRVEFADPVIAREARANGARTRQLLAIALQRLAPEDRRLLLLRYTQQRSVQCLAQRLRVRPKALYRRFDRMLASLRHTLSQQGVGAHGPDAVTS